MVTNKDIVKAAIITAIVTHGIDYIIEHWAEILAGIISALEALS